MVARSYTTEQPLPVERRKWWTGVIRPRLELGADGLFVLVERVDAALRLLGELLEVVVGVLLRHELLDHPVVGARSGCFESNV